MRATIQVPWRSQVFHRVFQGYLLILRLESQTLASEMAVARVGTGDFTLELAWSGRDPP